MRGKTVLVTGGARRIGAAIVRRLHARGANLLIHYRSTPEAAQALCDALNRERPGSAATARAAAEDLDGYCALAQRAVERFGRLDALVNNAATFFATPLGEAREVDWERLMTANVKAPFFLSQAAHPALRESRGCVVNLVDIHAERPMPNHPVYSVSKSAMAGLTRALALEMAPEVRVNGVSPGANVWPEGRPDYDAAHRDGIVQNTLLKRAGEPEDVARAVEFLIESPYVTGQILAVDGGRALVLD